MTPRQVIEKVVNDMANKPTLLFTTYAGYNLETLQGLSYPIVITMTPFSWRFVSIDGKKRKKYSAQLLFAHQESSESVLQSQRELGLLSMIDSFLNTLQLQITNSNGLLISDSIEDIGEMLPKEAESVDDTFGFYTELNIVI